ncbi:MAG: DEAD/DEAH box helicase [Novipirellula sp. JB048]
MTDSILASLSRPPAPLHRGVGVLSEPHFDPDRLAGFSVGVRGALDAMLAGWVVQSRPYQHRVIATAIRRLAGTDVGRDGPPVAKASRVLIESPHGSGKTVVGLATAALIQHVTGARVGWLAIRRRALAQAEAENRARRFGVRMKTIAVSEKRPPGVDLLVVEDVQQDAAARIAELHHQIQPLWTLGLSAAPSRSDRVQLGFDHVIRGASLASLIAEGYLSPYHHYTLPEYTPQRIAQLLQRDPQRWGRSLVFFHRRSECDLLYMLLRQAGVACEVVTETGDREPQLEAFAAGETQVLISMTVISEGFEASELQTVFCRPGGKGCTIQMAGQGLRPSRHVPIKQIVQCSQTSYRILRAAAAAEQYRWTQEGWQRVHPDRISLSVRFPRFTSGVAVDDRSSMR